MGKYSRTAKYEELRNSLQHDAEEQIETKDLSEFANRLNKLDAEEFKEMAVREEVIEPVRVRQESFVDEGNDLGVESVENTNDNQFTAEELVKDQERAMENTQKMAVFNNEYLDEYLEEVKAYNEEQGITTEDKLQDKLLREIRKEQSTNLDKETLSSRWSDVEEERTEILPSAESVEITKMHTKIAMELNQMLTEEHPQLFAQAEEQIIEQEDVVNMTDFPFNFEEKLAEERTAREALVEETTQMRVQLTEYKEELEGMEEKMHNSNRILNFILIVFILVCLVVIGVALYWILLNRGII